MAGRQLEERRTDKLFFRSQPKARGTAGLFGLGND